MKKLYITRGRYKNQNKLDINEKRWDVFRLELKNKLKEKLKSGKPAYGIFMHISHPMIADILSKMGLDWIIIDTEHGPWTIESVQACIQAMSGTDCTPLVRVWATGDYPMVYPLLIKRYLDIGVWGILVPNVHNKKETIEVVRACKYPPIGIRGFGPLRSRMYGLIEGREYAEAAQRDVLIAIQIESREAVEQIEDILSVEGLDAIAIGYADLSIDMFGLSGLNRISEVKQEMGTKILDAAKKANIPVITEWSLGTDERLLINGCKQAFQRGKQIV